MKQRLNPFDPELMEKLGFTPGEPCSGVTWRELMETRKKFAAMTPEETKAFVEKEEAKNPGIKVSVIDGIVHMWSTEIRVTKSVEKQ